MSEVLAAVLMVVIIAVAAWAMMSDDEDLG